MPLKISVVIPAHGRPVLLKRCLEALVKQTIDHRLFEVLVVGLEPDPATENLVRLFSRTSIAVRCRYLSAKKCAAAARNLGWKEATGSLIAFINEDLIPGENWLAVFANAYSSIAAKETALTGKIIVPLSVPPTDFEKHTAGMETADFTAANCCCTRAVLERTGGFDERLCMDWVEDSDYELKLLQAGIILKHVPEAVVLRPVCNPSWSNCVKEQKKEMFHALLHRKYPLLYHLKAEAHLPASYYAMLLCVLLALAGLLLSLEWLSLGALSCWLLLLADVTAKRLPAASCSRSYIAGIWLTSALIPFASVYWHWYGMWKYRTAD